MRKQLTKQDIEFQMFADYYKIYQDFYTPEDNDEYWESLIIVCEEFYRKYNNQYSADLITAYINSREAIYRLNFA
jgi:hypothetical protein